jgi:hypothetical protein
MWLFTLDGFYSAVQDKKDERIIWVRTRVREDLVRLIETYEVNSSPIEEDCGTDYKYRVAVWREEWSRVVAECALEIDYTNFKAEVKETLGKERADILGNVWWQLFQLQLDEAAKYLYGFIRRPLEKSSDNRTVSNPEMIL